MKLPGIEFVDDFKRTGIFNILSIFFSWCNTEKCNCNQKALTIIILGKGITIYNKHEIKF